jgi:formylglycine-generating enzyme required for sulfatase activity
VDEWVPLPAGPCVLGEPGEERTVTLRAVRIGRWPVVNADLARFFAATGRPPTPRLAHPVLADHPATDVTRADAEAFCAWASEVLQAPVRLPRGDEWEAAARGTDGRPWPWGESFDPDRCACAEAHCGSTVPVDSHPAGAGPTGAEQLAGNVWEWVADRGADGWGVVRGGSWMEWAWGVRASRALPADPERATPTTGFRVVIEDVEGSAPAADQRVIGDVEGSAPAADQRVIGDVEGSAPAADQRVIGEEAE